MSSKKARIKLVPLTYGPLRICARPDITWRLQDIVLEKQTLEHPPKPSLILRIEEN